MKELQIQKFCRENENWRELLSQSPYCLKIKDKLNLTIFSYDMYNSDFSNPIVNEARGIILNNENFNVVCQAFSKFYNYCEPFAAEIDWNGARAFEKIDGSIIKLYCHEGLWLVATNNTIDASEACYNENGENFGFLVAIALLFSSAEPFDTSLLNPNYTYIFELISPKTQVVIPYEKTAIYHIGTRNNITHEEVEVNIGVPKPQCWEVNCLEDVFKIMEQEEKDKGLIEGFVVVDKNYNRIKVKTEKYFGFHKTRDKIKDRWLVDLIRKGDTDELLGYFPVCRERVEELQEVYNKFNGFLEDIKLFVTALKNECTRKEFSEIVGKRPFSQAYFFAYDDKLDYIINRLDNKEFYTKWFKPFYQNFGG